MDNIFENFLLNGGFERARNERKKMEDNGEVLRDTIGDYTIDSCLTFDEGYETAIWKDSERMVVVERYFDKEDMQNGHKKWCKFCKNNPTEAYSVQFDEIKKF